MLAATGPFLGQLNPILQYLEMSQFDVADFITNGAVALADTTHSESGGVGHYLRQFGPLGAESAAMYHERLPTNRGNSYMGPLAAHDANGQGRYIFPNWDCRPSGGAQPPEGREPGCYEQQPLQADQQLQRTFPHVEPADYGAAR
jgi:phospholipid/cholesterol/gamma-HCH transport system substrate-binding protein